MRVTDAKLESAIGQMLRVGVLVAAGVVLAGAVILLRGAGGAAHTDYTHFHTAEAAASTVRGTLLGVRRGDGASIIQLGLLLLIATPIARVVLAGAGFLLERDWLYSVVSAVVFLILMYSVIFGR